MLQTLSNQALLPAVPHGFYHRHLAPQSAPHGRLRTSQASSGDTDDIRPDLEVFSPTGGMSLLATAHQIAVLRPILSLPRVLPSGYECHPSLLSDDWLLRAFVGYTGPITVVPLATKVRRPSRQNSFEGIPGIWPCLCILNTCLYILPIPTGCAIPETWRSVLCVPWRGSSLCLGWTTLSKCTMSSLGRFLGFSPRWREGWWQLIRFDLLLSLSVWIIISDTEIIFFSWRPL